jgi:hypothetical protein
MTTTGVRIFMSRITAHGASRVVAITVRSA